MKKWQACVVGIVLLSTLDAKADFVPVIGNTHFKWVGNYQTGAALYAACSSLVSSWQQNATTWCGTAAPTDNPNSYTSISGGWIQDKSQPAGVTKYYYLSAYACQNNDSVRYFSDTLSCSGITKMTMPVPSNPKANGTSCPANVQNRQPSCGNPIAIGTGNKVQEEIDFISGSPGLEFSLIRTYNGGIFTGYSGESNTFGKRWSHVVNRKLQMVPNRTETKCFRRNSNGQQFCENVPLANTGPAVLVYRPDGKIFNFYQSGDQWQSDADVDARLSAQYASDGITPIKWTYITPDDESENYDSFGRLLSVTSLAGATQRFTYSSGNTNDTNVDRMPLDAPACANVQSGVAVPAGLLICITDSWGRQLQFEYDSKSRVTKALDPAGQPYLYSYDGPTAGCLASSPNSLACSANNLTQVTYPDGKKRLYHYNESTRIGDSNGCSGVTSSGNGYGHLLNTLTGITDENGVRFASWNYDCIDRAIASEHSGGVEKVSVSYGTRGTDGTQTTTVVSSIGTIAAPSTISRNYHSGIILGVAKNDAVSQPCEGCSGMMERTYDSRGNVLSSKDWNGNKTVYTYEASRNLELSRTEAFGTTYARTTTATWHPTLRRPLKLAEPLRLTIFDYNANGNLNSKTVYATSDSNGSQGVNATPTSAGRTWTYTYNEIGQVLTVVGPLNEKTSYSYDMDGNLSSVTNAAQHVTSYSNYDGNGRVGRITDPNGLTTEISYTTRGWISSIVLGGESTNYDYDSVGQIIKVASADGSSLTYAYDSAHRLTGIIDSKGNSIVYTLDVLGNRITEQIKDSSGQLTKKVSRVYDSLNRLKQITGALQ